MVSADVLSIVERSTTVEERLTGSFNPVLSEQANRRAEERIARWKTVLKATDDDLSERISRAGLHRRDLTPILGAVRLTGQENLPAWAFLLQSILDIYENADGHRPVSRTTGAGEIPFDPVPFEEIFDPFVVYARNRLIQETGSGYYLFGELSHRVMERGLLQLLSSVSTSVLATKYTRLSKGSSLVRLYRVNQQAGTGHIDYKAFVSEMLRGGLRQILVEYAVLGRLLAVLASNWITSQSELINRFTSDRADLSAVFRIHSDIEKVAIVRPYLSDLHNGGSTVTYLQLGNGQGFIYKPRPVAAEAAYTRFLGWINAQSPEAFFMTPAVLDKENYGWMEYVPVKPLRGKEQARRYYSNVGALLAVLHALEATDAHLENIVMSGDCPVLVDAETLFQPRMRIPDPGRLVEGMSSYDSATVLRTELILRRGSGDNCQPFEYGGVHSGSRQQTRYRKQVWRNINTDRMWLDQEKFFIESPMAHVKDENSAEVPKMYLSEMLDGFEGIYKLFMKRKKEITRENGPLSYFSEVPVRYVFRPSRIYGLLFQKLLQPSCLKDGADWDIQSDILSRNMIEKGKISCSQILVEEEKHSLMSLDIPRFSTTTTSRDILLERGGSAKGLFSECSYLSVVKKIRAFNINDMKEQGRVIRAALATATDTNSDDSAYNSSAEECSGPTA